MNSSNSNVHNNQRIERNAVRVALFDACRSVLLIRIQDTTNPKFPRAWELPGGGLLEGETLLTAAIREIKEETGLNLSESMLLGPLWQRDVLYGYRGENRLQHEAIFSTQLTRAEPSLDFSGRDVFEETDFLEYRWWSLSELQHSQDIFYPRSLPSHISALAAGQLINDPIEIWPDFS